MTLGLLIPSMPAIATLWRGVVPPIASRVAEQAHSIINHRDTDEGNLLQMSSGSQASRTHGENSDKGSKESHPTRSGSDAIDTDLGALLGLGPHQILKTTEFEVRPSTSREMRDTLTSRPDWDGKAWV